VLERVDQALSVDETQARELPDATYCRYWLSSCQQFIDFGPASVVQEGDQLLTNPAIGFMLGSARYSDWSEPWPAPRIRSVLRHAPMLCPGRHGDRANGYASSDASGRIREDFFTNAAQKSSLTRSKPALRSRTGLV
jgi:hypothetical protein